MKELTLPAFRLAIFPPEGDDAGGGNNDGNQGGTDGGNTAGNQGGSDSGKQGGNDGATRQQDRSSDRNNDRHDRGNDRNDRRDDRRDDSRDRNNDGRFASADAERRINDLNEENKNRRIENRDLKSTVETLSRRTIVGDARDALNKAGAINSRVTELFLADMGDKVAIDKKTGNTTGLDAIGEWKKSNPEFFKAEDSGSSDDNDGDKGGDDKDSKDGKDGKDGKRGNSSAAAGSQGSGSGSGDDTQGLPDLTNLNPAERKAAIQKFKRGLDGAGARSGYGRASSKR